VDAPAAPAGWADGLPGVRPVRAEGSRVLVELDGAADDQAVLAAALRTGPVREFRRDRPSLSELFRHVVTGEEIA
jgi:ABC-2 type transport system ATP-binding protein